MAIHSSILAWKIPGTKEPGGNSSMGSQIVRRDSLATHTHAHTVVLIRNQLELITNNLMVCFQRQHRSDFREGLSQVETTKWWDNFFLIYLNALLSWHKSKKSTKP